VALDLPDLAAVQTIAAATGPYVSTMKVGLETFLRDGSGAVSTAREASGGAAVFLDLKLHDIPNTVAGAARSVAPLAPDFLTVHAAGGEAMIRAAVEALPGTRITAVTVLTSMGQDDLEAVGLRGPAIDAVRRLAVLAVGAGARAIVCSPQEVAAVRAEVDDDVVLITPGVRPAGTAGGDDQARVATPRAGAGRRCGPAGRRAAHHAAPTLQQRPPPWPGPWAAEGSSDTASGLRAILT
jgi:orotidine-5'-phosphate decarboxylase